MARITPRITPYVPKIRNANPIKLAKNAPRAIISRARVPSGITIPKPPKLPAATKTLLTQTHTGRSPRVAQKPPPPVNKPKPVQIRPIKKAPRTKIPTSMKALRPKL